MCGIGDREAEVELDEKLLSLWNLYKNNSECICGETPSVEMFIEEMRNRMYDFKKEGKLLRENLP